MEGLSRGGKVNSSLWNYFFILGLVHAVLEGSVDGWRRIELMGKGRFSKK